MKNLVAALSLSVLALWSPPSSAQSGTWWTATTAAVDSCSKIALLDEGGASCRYVYCADTKCDSLVEETVAGSWTTEADGSYLFSFPSVPLRSGPFEMVGIISPNIISPDIISPNLKVTTAADQQHPSQTLTYTKL